MPYTSQGRVRRIALVSALPMKPLAPRIMIFSAIDVLTRHFSGGRSLPRPARAPSARLRGYPSARGQERTRELGRGERQSHVVLGQRLGSRAGRDYVLELCELPAPVEWRVLFEAMKQRCHPPGEALYLPDPAQTGVRVRIQGFHGPGSAPVCP